MPYTVSQLAPFARQALGLPPETDERLAVRLALDKVREVNPQGADALLAELPGNAWTGAAKGFGRGLTMGLYNPTLMPDEEGLGSMAGDVAGMIGGFVGLGAAGLGRGLVTGATKLPGMMRALGGISPKLAASVGRYTPTALQALTPPLRQELWKAWPARTALGAAMGGVGEFSRQTLSPEAQLRDVTDQEGPSIPERLGGIVGQSALQDIGFGLPGAIAEGIGFGAKGGHAMLRTLPRIGAYIGVNVPTVPAMLALQDATDDTNRMAQPGALPVAAGMGALFGVLAGLAPEFDSSKFIAQQAATAGAAAKPAT